MQQPHPPPPPPPYTLLEWSIGKASAHTHGSSAVAGVARTLVYMCIQPRTALGTPTPDFSSELTPKASPMSGYGHKAAEVWNQSFPSHRWAVFPDWSAHLPKARVCVIHWHCTAQLSMFTMEKRYRNKIFIIIIIIKALVFRRQVTRLHPFSYQ